MRLNKVILGLLVLFVLASIILTTGPGGMALAGERVKARDVNGNSTSSEWQNDWPAQVVKHHSPTLSDLKADLDQSDFLAALKALNIALNEVGDGSTFVWRRKDHNLKGAIKPTSAFRSKDGRICRHIVFALSIGGYVKSIESIACRSAQGTWVIDG